MRTKTAFLIGKPDAGNPCARFDEGEFASAKPRRGSLLYHARTMATAFAIGFSLMTGGSAKAKTVALWPLAEGTSATYGACAIDARNDLRIVPSSGWEVQTRFSSPKQPGAVTTPTLFDPVTEKCLVRTEGAKVPLLESSSRLIGDVVSGTHDFTLEGYVKFTRRLDNSEWWVLARGGSTEASVWTFRLQKKSSALAFEMCGIGSDKRYETIDDSAEDFCDVWHHYALVFRAGTGNPVVEVFFDGTSCGSIALSARKDLSGATPRFDIAGRTTEATHSFLGGFDMWRLSDEALDASEFLNAANPEWKDVVTAGDVSNTVAYWPLTRNADGSLNACDVVNGNDLSSGYFPASPYFVQVLPDADGASVDGNAGAWKFPEGAASSAITAAGVAECLDVSRSFAVEMYLKPCHRSEDVPISQWVCSTTGGNSNSRGWILLFVRRAAEWQFELVANNGGEGGSLARDVPLTGCLNAWGETWKKIRLERDAVAGTWKLFVDGQSELTVTDKTQVVAGTAPSDFTFSGRLGNYTSSFAGSVDDIKLIDDSSSVVAHWPLDVRGGVDLDGAPKVGTVKLTNKEAKYTGTPYLPMAVEDDGIPVVTNPDAAAVRRGYSVRVAGCAAFQDVSSGMGYQYLATSSPQVTDALNGADGFTLEFWMNRTYSLGSNWEGLFFFFNGSQSDKDTGSLGSGTALATIAVQSNRLLLEDAGSFSSAKVDMTDNGDVWTLAKKTGWQHWAFVHDKTQDGEGQDVSRWRIYVGGELKSTLTSAWNVQEQGIRCLTLGGRYSSNKAFRGRLANVRLSKGVLEPGEFLNAAGSPTPTPADSETLAYWPLGGEKAGRTLAEPSGFELTEAQGSVNWSEQAARSRVRTTGFPYEKRNTGSLELGADGCLGSGSLTTAMSGPFTVEGWFKAGETDADGVLVTTDKGAGGWTLSLSETAEGAVFAIRNWYGIPYTSTVSAAFPAIPAALLDDWMHIALSHDPSLGCGKWTLFVNGAEIGAVSDVWKDVSLVASAAVSLGGGSAGTAAGLYDMWRFSRGVLGSTELMWFEKPGFVFFFR